MKYIMILVLACLTTACGMLSKKPSPPPTRVAITCQQPATTPAPKIPTDSIDDWIKYGPGWAVEVMAILSLEREYRKLEQTCYKVQNEY